MLPRQMIRTGVTQRHKKPDCITCSASSTRSRAVAVCLLLSLAGTYPFSDDHACDLHVLCSSMPWQVGQQHGHISKSRAATRHHGDGGAHDLTHSLAAALRSPARVYAMLQREQRSTGQRTYSHAQLAS